MGGGSFSSHLIVDSIDSDCMTLGAWELLDFVEFFGKVTGGEGRGKGETFIPLSGQS